MVVVGISSGSSGAASQLRKLLSTVLRVHLHRQLIVAVFKDVLLVVTVLDGSTTEFSTASSEHHNEVNTLISEIVGNMHLIQLLLGAVNVCGWQYDLI